MKTLILSHAKAQRRKGLRKLPGLICLAMLLFADNASAEPPEAPAKAIPVEEEDGAEAPAKPLPLKTPLTTFGGLNWVNKQIQRNIKGAVQNASTCR